MAKTLSDLLGGVNRLGTVETVKSGIPNPLPPSMFNVSRRVIGRSTTYGKSQGQRKGAQQNQYGAPAKQVQINGIQEVGVNMIHSYDVHNHNPLVLQNIMNQQNGTLQDLAVDELTRQVKNFMDRYDITRIHAVQSAIANGKIWLDATGNLLFSDSGAVDTIDYGVPANNRNQINGIITASWAVDSTDIVEDIVQIKRRAIETTGIPLKYALYSKNIPSYVAGNTRASALINANPVLANQFWSSGTLPAGFCGLDWVDVGTSFALTSAGVVTQIFGDDTIVFLPEISPEWYEMVEGSYLIPGGNLGAVSGDANGALSNITSVFGKFSYATVSQNPVTIQQFGGDTFLPIIKNGSAVFIADVTP